MPTPREESEKITSGESEPHHIGKKTKEVLAQERFSLLNTKRMFRGGKWQVNWRKHKQEFESFSIKDQEWIESEAKKLLRAE